MNTLNYFIEANICLVFFYALYRILLNNETRFGFNRTFLLGAMGISVAVPFLQVGSMGNLPAIGGILPAYLLPEVVVGSGSATDEVNAGDGVYIWSVVVWCYSLVAGLLTVRFLYRSVQLTKLIRTAPLFSKIQKIRVISVPGTTAAFSVFRYIVLGNPSALTDEERELILRHEAVHVQYYHTWDSLAAEILCIAFWFNPVTREIRKKLREVHEFQADQKASEGGDIREYCSLLARISLQSAGFGLASHFNKSLTIKRINMMKTIKGNFSRWKIAVLVPAVAGVLAFVACQDQVMSDLNTVAENSSVALDVPRQVQDRYAVLTKTNPAARYVILELQEEGQDKLRELRTKFGLPSTVELFESPGSTFNNAAIHKETMAAMILHETDDKVDDTRVFAILEYTDQVASLSNSTAQDEELFLIVEETAHPEDGIEKLYEFLKTNMRYPTKAREAGITGRVFIEFVVEKDGTLTSFKSVKGIGHGCDEEAIRVLSLSPPWNPGQQKGQPVRQKMVLPVVFAL